MAELYYPFESMDPGTVDEPVYDRAITAEMERSFNKLRYTNGVFSWWEAGWRYPPIVI